MNIPLANVRGRYFNQFEGRTESASIVIDPKEFDNMEAVREYLVDTLHAELGFFPEHVVILNESEILDAMDNRFVLR